MNTGKRCLQSRPRGPALKISPARKGWVHRQAVARRKVRHHTLCLFIRSEAEGSAVPRTSLGYAEHHVQTELSSRLSRRAVDQFQGDILLILVPNETIGQLK
jgi:hypothetical protein